MDRSQLTACSDDDYDNKKAQVLQSYVREVSISPSQISKDQGRESLIPGILEKCLVCKFSANSGIVISRLQKYHLKAKRGGRQLILYCWTYSRALKTDVLLRGFWILDETTNCALGLVFVIYHVCPCATVHAQARTTTGTGISNFMKDRLLPQQKPIGHYINRMFWSRAPAWLAYSFWPTTALVWYTLRIIAGPSCQSATMWDQWMQLWTRNHWQTTGFLVNSVQLDIECNIWYPNKTK